LVDANCGSADYWAAVILAKCATVCGLCARTHPLSPAAIWRNEVSVAVKIMKKDTMTCEAFLQEGAFMRHCNHKHLVRLFGVCSREEPLYLVCGVFGRW
jgi:hypothetical protein